MRHVDYKNSKLRRKSVSIIRIFSVTRMFTGYPKMQKNSMETTYCMSTPLNQKKVNKCKSIQIFLFPVLVKKSEAKDTWIQNQ